MIRPLIPMVLAFAVAACGDADTIEQSGDTKAQSEAAEAVDIWADAKLAADPDGVLAKGQELRRFGTPRAEVEAMAIAAFGAPPEQARNDECGVGPMDFSQYGPLQLAFQDDKFVGWYLSEGAGVATSDGVKVGSPLETLKAEHEVREVDSTLDGEFLYTTKGYGQITGFADADGTITAFAAGMTCFFR